MMQRSLLLALSFGTLSLTTAASIYLPTQFLPIYGGSGGTAFRRDCGAGKVLTGLRARTGLVVDAVGLLCRPVNSNGTLGSETTVGTLAGGGGGNVVVKHCSSGDVVIGAEIWSASFLDGISIHCAPWIPSTREFGANSGSADPFPGRLGTNNGTKAAEHCESSKQPASGIRGRAHSLVDAFGFICNEP